MADTTGLREAGTDQQAPPTMPRAQRVDRPGLATTAVVYLPPPDRTEGSSLLAISRRLADGESRRSTAGGLYVAREAEANLRFGQDDAYVARRCTIGSRSGAGELFCDVYEFDYRPALFKDIDKGSPAQKFLDAMLVTGNAAIAVARAGRAQMRLPGDRGPGRSLSGLQLLLGCGLALLLMAYVAFLGVAVVLVGVDASTGGWVPAWLTNAALTLAAVVALLPLATRTRFELASARCIRLLRYLSHGSGRGPATGQLISLLDELRERHGYRQVHVLGVSLGSVIALDALFPATTSATTVRSGLVDTLATVGCPHDTIRALQPAYYERRSACKGVPALWLNVLNPLDVLSSNFRVDGTCYGPQPPAGEAFRKPHAGDAAPASTSTGGPTAVPNRLAEASAPDAATAGRRQPRGVEGRRLQRRLRRSGPSTNRPSPATVRIAPDVAPPQNVVWSPTGAWKGPGLVEAITFAGLRAHAMYWDARYDGDTGCISELAPALFETGSVDDLATAA